jgi:ferredoxin-type protein NapF
MMAALVGFPSFALLDPMVVFNGFFTIFSQDVTLAVILSMLGLPVLLAIHLLLPGIWCTRLCPLGGLLDLLPRVGKQKGKDPAKVQPAVHFSPNRRRLFLASGAGLAVGLVVPKILKASGKAHFRPPGSVETDLFNLLCLRCGSCIKTCPSEILSQRSEPSDPMTWMTPEISFKKGYCLENCNLCSQVCPSGAITLFSPQAKKQLPIGLAVVIPDNCLLLKHTECDRCKTACTYKAITIDTKNAFQTLPLVEKDRCIGCGACAVICPPATIRMIPV